MRCPDEGYCHHDCETRCWRVGTCVPLSASGWDDWPTDVKDAHAFSGEDPYVLKSRPSERLPVEPLLVYLAVWTGTHDESIHALCARAGLHHQHVSAARESGWISLKLADALLVATGADPGILRELYPLAEGVVQ